MPSNRWNSESKSRSGGSGEKRFIAGNAPPRSIRATPLPTTTSRSRTSTRGSWTKPARRMRRLSNWSRPIRSSSRTSISSRKSMTARRKTVASLFLALVGALAGCTSYFEIPIETPISPKLDVGAFQRVLVAGFISGGSDEVDGNLETVRLLRSQLRTKGNLRVIDAEALPLAEIAAQQTTDDAASATTAPPASPAETAADHPALPPIKEEKDLEAYEKVFSNVEYWKKIGEEHQ